MKKWFSILMLSPYLFSTTELYQFLKVPILIEHFIEHKSQNNTISFFQFIKMHYQNPVKDADYDKDQKLPFIVHSEHMVVVFTITPRLHLDFKSHRLRLFSKDKIVAYDDLFLDVDYFNAIWQPPKFS